MKTNRFVIFLICVLCEISLVVYPHPDENLSITQLIAKYEYPVEEHTVETWDGYLLKTFRIPYGKGNRGYPKKVILIAHGLACSADDWVTLGPSALPYFLADRGFDVWLFNARGTRHSRNHKVLDPDKDAKQFWDFCWHEIALYDLPANINYILNHTNADNLFYIGHSQGGTSCLVMLSELPEMNQKIKAAVLLAPAAYFVDMQETLMLRFTALMYSVSGKTSTFYEFPPKTNINTNNLAKDLCSNPVLLGICYSSLYFGNLNEHPIDQDLLPVIVQHAPSTFSIKQVFHYIQIMRSGEFKKFDYGEKLNLKLYSASKPPFYNISSISTPMALFYGSGDFLSSPKSVQKLGSELKNEHLLHEIAYKGFNHIDFLWARNSRELIHEKAYAILMEYVN